MSSLVISGDTSGTVTVTVPAVAGTNTATLPAATGTVMVSGNMPAFSAYQSSAQTLATNTFTKLLFQTKEFDTNNNFASSTFTPTVAGYYQISGAISMGTTTSGIILSVYKNGAIYKTIQYPYGSSTYAAGGSCLVYCNGTTDYIDLYGYISVGQALDARAQGTYFQACLVRTA